MNDTQSASDPVTSPTRAEHAAGLAAYQKEGLRIAAEIGNRGPIRLTDGGRLHPDILEAYWRHGFYVFEGLIDGDEVAELRRDANEMLERAPVGPDAEWTLRGGRRWGSTTPARRISSPSLWPTPGAAPGFSADVTRRR